MLFNSEPSRSRRIFFGECADFFELGGAGGLAPFEDGGFGGGKDDAGGFQAAKGDLVIDGVAGADGVDGDVDHPSGGCEVESCLGDADVGFDAAEEDAVTEVGAPGVEERAARCSAKCEFRGRLMKALGEGGGKATELLGVLLGGGGGKAEGGGRVEESADVPLNSRAVRNDVQEFLLRVDDQECRIIGTHQLGRANGFGLWFVGGHLRNLIYAGCERCESENRWDLVKATCLKGENR
jgi:hypothetical protein